MDMIFRLPESAFGWADYLVVWVGFSTVVGLLATVLVLGRNGLPTVGTVIMGYVGTIVSWSIVSVYYTSAAEKMTGADSTEQLWKLRLLSPAAFVLALVGTVGLLLIYKVILQQGAAKASQSE